MDRSYSVTGGWAGGEGSLVTFQKPLILSGSCFLVCKEG